MLAKILPIFRARYGRPVDLRMQTAAYRQIPPMVLSDLAEYCGAIEPAPMDEGSFKQGRAAGRRDVWLRIQAHRVLNEAELYALLKGEFITKE